MSQKILITGATGTIGKELINALKGSNATIVAGVRDVAAARQKINGNVQFKAFDFEQPDTFAAATEGVDKVFLLGPPLRVDLDVMLYPFIDFLNQVGIKRVVYFSAMGLDKVKELPFHTNVIRRLKEKQFDLTILEPTFFAQNFKNFEWQNITERGIIYVPAADGRAAFVDVKDIAHSAAAVLTQDGHSGKTYVLTGSETFSYGDVATILTQLTGRNVVYTAPSPEEFKATLQQSGAPDFIADYMIGVYALIKEGHVNYVSGDVELLTGSKPTSLKKVLQHDFAAQPA